MRVFSRLIATGAALLCVGVASAAAPFNSLHMTSRTSDPTGKGKAMTIEMWMKNGKMRTKIGDQIMINDGKNMIMYNMKDPKKQMMVRPLPPNQKSTSTAQMIKSMAPANLMKGAKKVGTAKVAGRNTTIYQVSNMPGSKGPVKMWMANDMGMPFPLRIEGQGPMGRMVHETTLLQINPNLPNSLFTAPAGYKRMTMPSRPPMPPGGKR